MSKPTFTVGLIGYQFMGKAHSNAYRQLNHFFDLPYQVRMKTVCGRTEGAVKEAAENLGWEGYETDWRKVIADPEIDAIDISTPGSSHCEIACAAAEAGKILLCEKPIGNTLAEAQQMADAVKKNGKPSLVFHNYRGAPAVAMIKKMIEEGQLGKIYHFRATYLQDWIADPEFPLVWRLKRATAGSGAHGDIGSHIIDLGQHLVGDISEVSGLLHTFITERPVAGEIDDRLGAAAGEKREAVDVDDASLFLAKFGNGALGTFEATRFAVGRKNYNRFEINGSKGSVAWNMERMNEFEYYNNDDPEGLHGFRLVQATEAAHPYAGHYWPVGHIIGYEHTFMNLLASGLEAFAGGRDGSPNMADGLKNQKVLDAVERSSQSQGWVGV